VCAGKARAKYAALGVDVRSRCGDALVGGAAPEAGERLVFPFLNSGLYAGRRPALRRLLADYAAVSAERPNLEGQTDQAVFHAVAVDRAGTGGDQLTVDVEAGAFLNCCCPRGSLLRGLSRWTVLESMTGRRPAWDIFKPLYLAQIELVFHDS